MDSKKFTILSVAIFVLSLLVFVSTVFLVVFKPTGDSQKEKSKKNIKTENVEIGDISTQVGNSGRYYKGFVVLEVKGKKTPDNLDKKMPQVKDSIITTISYSKINDITTEEGMINLKARIKSNVNEILGTDDVVNVLFTQSILQ